jgi:hypothetical protein
VYPIYILTALTARLRGSSLNFAEQRLHQLVAAQLIRKFRLLWKVHYRVHKSSKSRTLQQQTSFAIKELQDVYNIRTEVINSGERV